MTHYNFNKINLDINFFLRSECHVTLNIIGSDLKVVMIHIMYI